MHNAIDFPEEPKRPKEPIEKNYNNKEKYEKAIKKFKEDLQKYNEDMINYKITLRIKPNSTFHHLYVVYKEGSKKPDFDRLKKYLEADIPKKDLQEFLKIDYGNVDKKDQNEDE